MGSASGRLSQEQKASLWLVCVFVVVLGAELQNDAHLWNFERLTADRGGIWSSGLFISLPLTLGSLSCSWAWEWPSPVCVQTIVPPSLHCPWLLGGNRCSFLCAFCHWPRPPLQGLDSGVRPLEVAVSTHCSTRPQAYQCSFLLHR